LDQFILARLNSLPHALLRFFSTLDQLSRMIKLMSRQLAWTSDMQASAARATRFQRSDQAARTKELKLR
jgi:hypothetical protein